MAAILISHDLGVVSGRSDDVAVMYAGRIVERASARRFFEQPLHPYARGLLDSKPRLENPPGEMLSAIPGRAPDLARWREAGCHFAPRCPNARARCRQTAPPLEATDGRQLACYFPLGEPLPPDRDGPPLPVVQLPVTSSGGPHGRHR